MSERCKGISRSAFKPLIRQFLPRHLQVACTSFAGPGGTVLPAPELLRAQYVNVARATADKLSQPGL